MIKFTFNNVHILSAVVVVLKKLNFKKICAFNIQFGCFMHMCMVAYVLDAVCKSSDSV